MNVGSCLCSGDSLLLFHNNQPFRLTHDGDELSHDGMSCLMMGMSCLMMEMS